MLYQVLKNLVENKQKGIYPYEYMNSFEIFDEIRVLSDEDDQHAIKV